MLWNPNLKLVRCENSNISKIELLLKILQKFQGITDNEEDIIKLYTNESGSYHQDFNNRLNHIDPLAIQKTSRFIATAMYSLNSYANKKGKGVTQ